MKIKNVRISFKGIHKFEVIETNEETKLSRVQCSVCGLEGVKSPGCDYVEVSGTKENKKLLEKCTAPEGQKPEEKKPEQKQPDKKLEPGKPGTLKQKILIAELFTDAEMKEFGVKLGKHKTNVDKIETDKKESDKKFKEKIDEENVKMNELFGLINKGFREIYADCEIQYHFPKKDRKCISRCDGKLIEGKQWIEREMSPEDYNLFSQVPEEKKKAEKPEDKKKEENPKQTTIPVEKTKEVKKPVKSKKEKTTKINIVKAGSRYDNSPEVNTKKK